MLEPINTGRISHERVSRGRVFGQSMAWVGVLLVIDAATKFWAYQQGIAVLTKQPTLLAWLPTLPPLIIMLLGAGLCYLALDAIISCINRREIPQADILFAAGLLGNGLNLLFLQYVVDFIPIPLWGHIYLIANGADGFIMLGFVWLVLEKVGDKKG